MVYNYEGGLHIDGSKGVHKNYKGAKLIQWGKMGHKGSKKGKKESKGVQVCPKGVERGWKGGPNWPTWIQIGSKEVLKGPKGSKRVQKGLKGSKSVQNRSKWGNKGSKGVERGIKGLIGGSKGI